MECPEEVFDPTAVSKDDHGVSCLCSSLLAELQQSLGESAAAAGGPAVAFGIDRSQHSPPEAAADEGILKARQQWHSQGPAEGIAIGVPGGLLQQTQCCIICDFCVCLK